MRRVLLAGVTLLALVLPVVALGVFVQGAVARDLLERSSRDRVATAELASRLLAHVLDDAASAVDYVAQRDELRAAFVAGDRTRIARELLALGAAWPALGAILAIDARGTEIVVAADGAAAGVPANSGLPLLTGSGIGQDRSSRDYFVGALTTDRPFVSAAYRSAAPGGAVLVAVSRAVRDHGVTVGVIAATLEPRGLLVGIEGMPGATGRTILILDKSSRVVASTDRSHPPLSELGLPGLADALAGSHGSRTVTLDGRERILTAVPVDGALWVLYVVDDPAVALAVERGLQRTVTVGAGAALILAIATAAVVVVLFAQLARRREELDQSRRELEESNAALALASMHKSEFLSSVSHELRTPLNAIIGFTDLLDEQLRDGITERQRRYFRNVRTAGDHLLELINDVLDLSRVESGRIELHPEPIAIEQLVEPVAANARRSAAEKGLTYECALAPGTVRVDAGRMRQVLFNLTSNAVKFTNAGRIACRAAIEGDALVIEVSDSGIGIPADRRGRVFAMFERVNEDRSSAKGTGLGLALSKMLVELHGGEISFESVEDRGTTFRVRIPGVVVSDAVPGGTELADAHPPR